MHVGGGATAQVFIIAAVSSAAICVSLWIRSNLSAGKGARESEEVKGQWEIKDVGYNDPEPDGPAVIHCYRAQSEDRSHTRGHASARSESNGKRRRRKEIQQKG